MVFAQTAKAMDIDAKIYYLGHALKILLPGEAEKIKLGTFPSVAEMIKKTLDMGIKIYVCEASKQMLGWDKIALIPGVKIVGADLRKAKLAYHPEHLVEKFRITLEHE